MSDETTLSYDQALTALRHLRGRPVRVTIGAGASTEDAANHLVELLADEFVPDREDRTRFRLGGVGVLWVPKAAYRGAVRQLDGSVVIELGSERRFAIGIRPEEEGD